MTVDVVRIQNDLAYARNCYIDYKKNGSASGITEDDFQIIEDNWSRYFSTWDTYMNSQDENGYTIVDDDYDGAVQQGRNNAEDLSGYENDGWDITGQVGENATALGTGGGMLAEGAITAGVFSKGLATATKEGFEKGGKAAAEEAAGSFLKEAGILIACAFDAVTAGLYWIFRPNKTEKEVVDVYAGAMDDQQAASEEAQDKVIDAGKVVKRSAEEAEAANESANAEMAKSKTDYAMYQRAYEYLQSEQTRGTFDEEDAANYEECVRNMTDKGKDIDGQKTMAEKTVGKKYEDMKGQESEYDDAKNAVGEVEGFTKEAAGLDVGTKIACYAQATVLGINGLKAAWDSYKAFAAAAAANIFGGVVYAIAGGAAAVAAGSDAYAAYDQYSMAQDIGKEIDARYDTEDLNADSLDICEEKTEDYKEYLADTENLELVIPDGVDAPTDTSPTPTDGDDGGDGDGPKKKPEE